MFCSINGRRVFELNLIIPSRGLWTADAKLDTGDALSSTRVTLALAGLTLAGAAYRSGSFSGTLSVRMVGGFGGWYQNIDSKFYKNPFGLRIAPILTDAATAVGERITVATDTTVGPFFARERGPAVRCLNQLADQWYVQPDGTTYVGPRTTPTIASRFDVMVEGTRLQMGRVMIATDFPEQWTPGCLFSSPTLSQRQASTITHRLTKDALRTEVWTSP